MSGVVVHTPLQLREDLLRFSLFPSFIIWKNQKERNLNSSDIYIYIYFAGFFEKSSLIYLSMKKLMDASLDTNTSGFDCHSSLVLPLSASLFWIYSNLVLGYLLQCPLYCSSHGAPGGVGEEMSKVLWYLMIDREDNTYKNTFDLMVFKVFKSNIIMRKQI